MWVPELECVIDALDRIEARLGKMFIRHKLSQLNTSTVTHGIIVSIGTALDENQKPNAAGCVSESPNQTGWPRGMLRANGEINCRLYVNLGSANVTYPGDFKWSSDIAIHEFGHALGLGDHFHGFGLKNGGIISSLFWDVLKSLYPEGLPRKKE